MTWTLTATGRRFDLAAPDHRQIVPMDIAWALAQLNRFTGHALRPYSVAEHSLLVCEIAQRELRLDARGLFAALTHDAHEAYVGDLCSPAKWSIGEPWHSFEERIEHAVRTAFGTHVSAHMYATQIKRADLIALATEKRDLMPSHHAGALPWPVLNGIKPVEWADLRTPWRSSNDWEAWRDAWLDCYHTLDAARNSQTAAATS